MENKKENQQERSKKEQLNSYVKYSGMAFQMIGTMMICMWLGMKLDEHFKVKSHLFTIFLLVFGVIASIYLVIRSLLKK